MKLTLEFAGQTGVNPRLGRLLATEYTLAQIQATGFLNNEVNLGNTLNVSDYIFAYCSDGRGAFNPVYSDGSWTLIPSFINAGQSGTQHITAGNLEIDAGEIISGIGTGGFTGTLRLYPTTASKGSLVWQAVANAGDTVTTFQTAALGQATTYTFPDPAGAAGRVGVAAAALVNNNLLKASGVAGLFQDTGYAMKVVTGAVALGGSPTQNFSDAFVTPTSVIVGNWTTSENAVTVQKIVPGTSSFDVISSNNAGAGTFSYVVFNISA